MSRHAPARMNPADPFSVFDDREFWDQRETEAVPKRLPKVEAKTAREVEREAFEAKRQKVRRKA